MCLALHRFITSQARMHRRITIPLSCNRARTSSDTMLPYAIKRMKVTPGIDVDITKRKKRRTEGAEPSAPAGDQFLEGSMTFALTSVPKSLSLSSLDPMRSRQDSSHRRSTSFPMRQSAMQDSKPSKT